MGKTGSDKERGRDRRTEIDRKIERDIRQVTYSENILPSKQTHLKITQTQLPAFFKRIKPQFVLLEVRPRSYFLSHLTVSCCTFSPDVNCGVITVGVK